MRDGEVAPFNDLQQRLNRKTSTPKMLARVSRRTSALYDLLFDGGEDLRAAAASTSAARGWRPGSRATRRARIDLSPLIAFADLGASCRRCAPARAPPASRG